MQNSTVKLYAKFKKFLSSNLVNMSTHCDSSVVVYSNYGRITFLHILKLKVTEVEILRNNF